MGPLAQLASVAISGCEEDGQARGDVDCSADSEDLAAIRDLLERHVALTGSVWGRKVLDDLEHFMFQFRVVRPKVDQEARKQAGTLQSVPLKVVG